MKDFDIIIIGAGASGLAAAISARRKAGHSVLVLESAARAGKKLSSSGNGRGNVSNLAISPSCYHSQCHELIKPLLKPNARQFLASVGLYLRSEEDRLYPYSFQASAVTDLLLAECARLDVNIATNCAALSVDSPDNGFTVHTKDGALRCRVLILSTGGAAFNGSSFGYTVLKGFGHTITPLLPSLVQLNADMTALKGLRGVKCNAKLTLCDRVFSGELLFTDTGISGNAVFALSGYAARRLSGGENVIIHADLMPDITLKEVESAVLACKPSPENALIGLFHKNLTRAILARAGIDLSSMSAGKIAAVIKNFPITVTGTCGINRAQVTAGGARLDEFTEELMSKRVRGLFCTGETLDVDGDCGGFNLHFAWCSGIIAGEAAAKYADK